MDKKELYRSIITSNATKPHKMVSELDNSHIVQKTKSTSCSDEYDVAIKIEGDKVVSASFKGHGCSISKSSLNLICSYIENKSVDEAKELIINYKSMITGKEFNTGGLEDLIAFENVHQYLNRVGCASMGATVILKILEGSHGK